MKRRISKSQYAFMLLAILFIWLAVLISSGCSRTSTSKNGKKLYRVGVILNLTGNLALADEPKKRDLLVAQDYINENGGINGRPLELIIEDSKTDPKESVNALRKIQTTYPEINVFLTGTSLSTNPIVPITESQEDILFAISGDPALLKGRNYVIRCFPEVTKGAKLMADYLIKNKIKDIYILHTNEPYGKSYMEALRKAYEGHGDIQTEEFKLGQRNFREILIKVKASKAERIVIIDFAITLPSILKQISEMGIEIPVLANETFQCGSVSNLKDKPVMKTIVFLSPTLQDRILNDPEHQFTKLHRKKYGKDPQVFGVYGADSLLMLQHIAKNTNLNDTQRMMQAIKRIKNLEGFSGIISVINTGDIDYELGIYHYNEEGKPVPLSLDKEKSQN